MTKQLLTTLLLLLLAAPPATAQTWYPANEPFGGRVATLHEATDGALLCGTLKGLYRSTDNGQNWQNISGAYGEWSFGNITSTPSGAYLVTKSIYELLRSTDAGQSWQTLPTPNWTSMNRLITNSNGQLFAATNNSVWRSDDDGDTWTQLTVGPSINSLRSLVSSPDDDLFVGTYNSKIFRSTDNGDTWTEMFTAANDIGAFAFVGSDVVYALTSFAGFYKSTDNGTTWTLLPALPGTNGGFTVAANAAGDLFIGSYDEVVLRSMDDGNTWTDISYDLANPAANVLMVNANDELVAGTRAAGVQLLNGTSWTPRNHGMTGVRINRLRSFDGVLYACTDYGVFSSTDDGQTWQQSVMGMVDTEVLAIAKAPNGDLYAGAELLYRSQDGVTWTDISSGFPGGEAYVMDLLAEPSGRVIAATDEWGMRYSDDQGASWTTANTGLDDVTMTFIRKAANGYFFTADGYNLYRSNDLTQSWEVINDGLADTDIEEFAAGNGMLFASTYSDGLFMSSDNGDNWTLAIDEDFTNVTLDGTTVYGCSESGTTGGVYRSLDNGATWTNIVAGLPHVQVEEVHFAPGLGLFARVRDHGIYTLDFSVVGLAERLPAVEALDAFPNPFTDQATLRLTLDTPAQVRITTTTLQGSLVQRSAPRLLPRGVHDLPVGEDLSPGLYLLTVEADGLARTVRLVKSE